MTGNELRNKIKEAGFELKKISELLKISPQALNSKLNAASVKSDFAERINSIIKPSVYQHMDTEKPAIVSEPGAEIIPDAAMPGIYQDIIKALINRSDDLADLAKAQIRVTDALLEERQLARDTAHSVAAIAAKVTGAQPGLYATKKDIDRIAVSLDKMAVSTEAAQVFFAQRIAALEGAQSVDVAEALDNVLMDAEEARKKSRKIASHS